MSTYMNEQCRKPLNYINICLKVKAIKGILWPLCNEYMNSTSSTCNLKILCAKIQVEYLLFVTIINI